MKTKRLAAAATAMLLAITAIALMSAPAAAHHEQSCTTQPEYVRVQVGTRPEPYTAVNLHGDPVTRYRDVPVYEIQKQMVTTCTTISHPPEYRPRDRYHDCVGSVITSSIFWNDVGVIACFATSGG